MRRLIARILRRPPPQAVPGRLKPQRDSVRDRASRRPAGTRMAPPPVRRSRRARWLRRGLRAGIVLFVLAALAGSGFWLVRSRTGGAMLAQGGDRFLAVTAALGFTVQDIDVEGRDRTSREAILGILGVGRGSPLFAIDPAAAKAKLETLAWVRSAAVERLLPDTLHIRLVERQPLAFWQRQGKLSLIDRDGKIITEDALGRFPGLLVLVGEDAPEHAAALLDILAQQPDVAKRVVAAVRVGGRRWNLRLANGIDVQLPEKDTQAAWAQLAEIDKRQSLLQRDVQMIDLRLPDRLVVRVAPEAAKEAPKKTHPGSKNT
jgi:cell division protein FtsQ